MSKKKIYIVGGLSYYHSFINNAKIEPVMEKADIVLFTGGEDIDPKLYGEKEHPYTHINRLRDNQEEQEFLKAISLSKPMIGICRGSQMLTVMAGGKLIQHVDNHSIGYRHEIRFLDDNDTAKITSTHHQMMNPYGMDPYEYKIIAVSSENRATQYEGGDGMLHSMSEEPEIVFYPKIEALAIQGHPENMENSAKAVVKINELIDKLFGYE